MKILFLAALLLLPSAAMAEIRDVSSITIERRDGAQVPLDTPVKDEKGRETTLAALANGQPILLAPVQHRCPNICGVTLSGLMAAIEQQPLRPGDDFTVIAFSFDPREGTDAAREVMADLRKRFPAMMGGVHAVTASENDIAKVTDALGYRYTWDEEIGQYAHVAAVSVLTAEGGLSRWIYGLSPDATQVRLALTEAGDGTVGNWQDQLLLLCYHYDPETGRYSPLIWTIIRAAGATTVAAGGSLLAFAFLRRQNGARNNDRSVSNHREGEDA